MGKGKSAWAKLGPLPTEQERSCSERSTSDVAGFCPAIPIIPPCRFSTKRHKLPAHESVEDLSHCIFQFREFLSGEECSLWIEYAEQLGFVLCDQPSTRDMAQRKQGRVSFESTDVANAIFNRLYPVLEAARLHHMDGLQACGCLANIRVYRYVVGDSFGRHVDESSLVEETGCCSKLTLLVYLSGAKEAPENSPMAGVATGIPAFSDEEVSSPLIGGETMFYMSHTARAPLLSVTPRQGSLLLHAHGRRCLTHEAAPVVGGVKYVLRTDVVYGPPEVDRSGSSIGNKSGGGSGDDVSKGKSRATKKKQKK